MPLKSYFDDSGHYENPGETACIVGGFIAEAEHWNALEPDWKEILHRYEVREFKASHLQSLDHEYKNWDPEGLKRKAFYAELFATLKKHFTTIDRPIAALLPIAQFSALPKTQQSQWGGDPYYVCLQDVLEASVDHAQKMYVHDESIAVLCDQEPREVRIIAERVYESSKNALPNGSLLTSFGFGESHEVVGLQVADLVAYQALQLQRARLREEEGLIDKLWWPMERLSDMFFIDFEFYADQTLLERKPYKNYSSPD